MFVALAGFQNRIMKTLGNCEGKVLVFHRVYHIPMPALATRTYENITPEKWRSVQEAAATYGFNLEQHQGQADSYGADVRWNLRPDRKVLTVEVWRSSLLSLDQVVSILGRMIQNA